MRDDEARDRSEAKERIALAKEMPRKGRRPDSYTVETASGQFIFIRPVSGGGAAFAGYDLDRGSVRELRDILDDLLAR